jgi:leucine-rich repeat protein SHOC2
MEQAALEQIIEQARLDRSTSLDLQNRRIVALPESIGNLSDLETLDIRNNQIIKLPKSIGNLSKLTYLWGNNNLLNSLPESVGNLSNLKTLDLRSNRLIALPNRIGNLSKLANLYLSTNRLDSLPESIGNLSRLIQLNLNGNQLTNLQKSIGNLSALTDLCLSGNRLTSLIDNMKNLSNLTYLYLMGNPLTDLSVLQEISNLRQVEFIVRGLPYQYWTKLSAWQSEWLLDEDNAELRRVLIQNIGYEKICKDLGAIVLDTWKEYTLLSIEGISEYEDDGTLSGEPMVLLKMNCPSTAHIHILRVPPEMTSAEKAITWINHGIHPDEFTIQT